MAYLTRQSVREESGFQEVQEPEALAGVADGNNKNFAVSRTPIVDRNDDNAVTTADAIVRVNGVPVDVSEIEPTTGLITLVQAPADAAEVTAEYATSALPDSYIDKLIVEAESIVNSALSKFGAVPLSEENLNYAEARRVALFYASGFALIRDYGKNTDDTESAKDGYAKLEQADKMLKSLMAKIKDGSTSSSSGGSVKAVSEGHIFGRRDCDTRSHDYFMRKRC